MVSDPDDFDLHWFQARALHGIGKTDAAIAELEKLAIMISGDKYPGKYRRLAEGWEIVGNPFMAVKFKQMAKERGK